METTFFFSSNWSLFSGIKIIPNSTSIPPGSQSLSIQQTTNMSGGAFPPQQIISYSSSSGFVAPVGDGSNVTSSSMTSSHTNASSLSKVVNTAQKASSKFQYISASWVQPHFCQWNLIVDSFDEMKSLYSYFLLTTTEYKNDFVLGVSIFECSFEIYCSHFWEDLITLKIFVIVMPHFLYLDFLKLN